MSKNQTFLLALGCAVLAFALFAAKVRNIKTEVLRDYGQMTNVVVAVKDLLPGTVLEKDDVQMDAKVPAKFMQPGALVGIEFALGRTVQTPIRSGEQVLDTKLMAEEGGLLSLRIRTEPDRRAITLKMDGEGALAGLLRPGDVVDIIGVFESESGADAGAGNHAMVLVQAVKVLAVDDRLSELPAAGASGGRLLKTESPSNGGKGTSLVTLDVGADEAWKLSLAAQIAHLRCILRYRTNVVEHPYVPLMEERTKIESGVLFGAGGKTIWPSGQPGPDDVVQ
ncbi:MAG: Flp pilus assembly protein CpaB [Lentisphaerae bacterium]|nr:Flp pilus assembly protein CpaB [Lentisphaerota bacterium]